MRLTPCADTRKMSFLGPVVAAGAPGARPGVDGTSGVSSSCQNALSAFWQVADTWGRGSSTRMPADRRHI